MSLYISPNGTDHINTLGSFHNPFQSLAYALSRITAESKIICLEGVYDIPYTEVNIDGITIEGQENTNVVLWGISCIYYRYKID